jgi:N-acetylmuramoyl-L-alanine amidase
MYTRVILIVLLLLSLSPGVSGKGKKVSKVVLDAGHGGHDIGARGQISYEKNLTLAVVLRLGKIMRDSMKDVQVLYTRTSDVYPKLTERHEVANQAKADLFVSVHVNSTMGKTVRTLVGHKTVKKGKKKVQQPIYKTVHHRETSASGVETYVLGLHRSSQNQNAIGEYGDNIAAEPGLLNENDPQTAIIIAQYAQAFLTRSVALASRVQQQFSNQGRKDLGVKQMGLEVLAGSAMPGVLIEIGFINNPDEEAYLNTEEGQLEVAMAIFRGIRAYKIETER